MLRPLFAALLLAGVSGHVAANTDLMTIYQEAHQMSTITVFAEGRMFTVTRFPEGETAVAPMLARTGVPRIVPDARRARCQHCLTTKCMAERGVTLYQEAHQMSTI